MQLMEYLDNESATYRISEHRPAFTAQQVAAEEHVSGMKVAKPVIVKADDTYYMCVLPACYKVDLDAVKKQLRAEQIGFADESEMAKLFADCALGAQPPFGNLYGMVTFMDEALEADEEIVFQDGTHERAVTLKMADYIRLVNPCIMSFSYPSS